MTVYADILFLVNFSMDLLTLIFASRITHRSVKRLRLILGAMAGGFGGTLLSLIRLPAIAGNLLSAALMAGMTVITFGLRGNMMRMCLIVCGSGTLLGGIMTAILSLGEPVMLDYGSVYPSVFLGCAAAAWGFTRLFAASSVKKSAEVTVTAQGITRTFTALCDSGCFLTEPISGMPVITASEDALGTLAGRVTNPDSGLRLRIIPVKTVTGSGMLYGFVPDAVSVDGIEVRAAVAVDEGERGGFDGIVPASLAGTRLHKWREL
ncbi:MAG: sigma-E processing peptidase SpoIIGA [Clostridia bacterium]|nr:sigma-E processing peptidase SpoIIGA [Clostridia bacterium]